MAHHKLPDEHQSRVYLFLKTLERRETRNKTSSSGFLLKGAFVAVMEPKIGCVHVSEKLKLRGMAVQDDSRDGECQHEDAQGEMGGGGDAMETKLEWGGWLLVRRCQPDVI
jgi:hypothetical protein